MSRLGNKNHIIWDAALQTCFPECVHDVFRSFSHRQTFSSPEPQPIGVQQATQHILWFKMPGE